ncbi:MAG: hypothetical protein QOC81_4778 [Thermoanaerobaculia bacterium]|jgi:hypothetical protein|nr:hypothetical protein [Thermoanaerobaculia bacterium]
MKSFAIAMLSLSLATVSGAATIALGIGAASPNKVILKIEGRNSHIRLDGVKPSGDPAAATFLRCLVAGRIVRLQMKGAGTAKVTMLDGTAVSDLVNEYLDTTTKIEPCALGKASYQPKPMHVDEAALVQPKSAKKGSAQKPETAHISYAPSSNQTPAPFRMPPEVTFPERQAAPPPPPKAPDVPRIATPGTMSTYTPGRVQPTSLPTSSTTTVGTSSTDTIGTAQPATPPTATPYTPPVTVQKPPGA